MQTKTYNFQNPEVQQKAMQKARVSARPKVYNSKLKRVEEAKKELIREELLRDGFLQQVGVVLPKVTKAMITSACSPNASGSSDRRLIYSALGILNPRDQKQSLETIGDILARLTLKQIEN